MKLSLPAACAAIALATLLTAPALLATESIDEVIETMHQAEQSAQPLPILQKAMDQLKHYNPRVHASGPHRNWSNNQATLHHKEEAMNKLQEAIDLATSGQSPVEKIHASVSEMHLAGEFKH